MTIEERFEEIRNYIDTNISNKIEYSDYSRLRDIIDEAEEYIERQSITNEDVRKAIDMLEVIYPSPKQIATGEYPEVAEAIDLAIAALEQMQTEPCELIFDDSYGCELWICSNCKTESVFETDPREFVKYCWNCGRKLRRE